MKYRAAGVAVMALMLLAALCASIWQPDSPYRRVHQHMTARQPDAGCDCDGTGLCSHLPLVILETGGVEIPGKPTGKLDAFGQELYTLAADGRDIIDASLCVIDNPDGNNHPQDAAALTTAAEIRVRGHSSRHFAKSSYQLDFVDEQGTAAPAEVMGMAAHSEWVLYGPCLDKSLVRNYMWYNISGEIMEWAPNVRYCELILNGEYQGLYLMTETITDGENGRLNLSTTARNTTATGYLLRSDRTTEEDLGGVRDIFSYLERTQPLITDVRIRYPKRSDLTEALRRDIELDYAAFEKALYSYDYDTDNYGYWHFIDVDNFVDYYLINEFTVNVDMGYYSHYLYKDLEGKYKLAVWDFNNTCDNYIEDRFPPETLEMASRPLYYMLTKHEGFAQQVLARYDALRQTVLSEEYLMTYIDDTLAFLGPAVERNNRRWQELMTQWAPLEPAERNLYSHEEAVEQLKTWLCERGRWLDENFHTLQQYSHPSRNKAYDH